MSQEVFRKLVSASRTEQVDHGQENDGDQERRDTQKSFRPNKGKDGNRTLSFMPRQVGKEDAHETHSKDGYMDRAEMRRRGLEVPVDASLSALNQTKRRGTSPDPQAVAGPADDSDESVSDTELEAALEVGRAQKQSSIVQNPAKREELFRPVVPQDFKPDFIYVNGKRLRRKKKQAPTVSREQMTDRSIVPNSEDLLGHSAIKGEEISGNLSQDNDLSTESKSRSSENFRRVNVSQAVDNRSKEQDKEKDPVSITTNESQSKSAFSFAPRTEEEEDDIFADAGQWQGLSDEEVSQTQKSRQGQPGDWFSSEPETKATRAEIDASVTRSSTSPASSRSSEESEEDSAPVRLQGLESSALSTEMSRWLLERNDSLPSKSTSGPPRKRKRSKKGRGQPDSP